jgi:hypothetical protein
VNATSPHFDDERLSSALDAPDDAVAAHLGDCSACRARSDALAEASAFAASPVAPLDPVLLDALIATAVAEADRPAEGGMAPVLEFASRRRRRLYPPPAWLVGAAAALVLLAGIASVLRPSSSADRLTSAVEPSSPAANSLDSAAGAGAGAGDAGSVDNYAVGEEMVGDLGNQADPNALVAAIQSTPRQYSAATARAAGGAPKGAAPPTSSTTTTWPANKPRCEAAARAIGGANLGALDSPWTVRWKGADAEVLVFTLTKPSGNVTKQAMVLRRPDCVLLADPRF